MNATSLTDSAEPEPPKRSFWKRQVPDWCCYALIIASVVETICSLILNFLLLHALHL